LGIPVLEHIEVTPEDIRKLAGRLTGPERSWPSGQLKYPEIKEESAEVLRACADVVEAAKETVTTHPVKAYKGHQKMIEALARLEALKL
jgi:hypothetical protein